MRMMENQIPDWKQKFPEAKHAPDPNCKKCHGVGYIYKADIDLGDFVIEGHDSPCICIFVNHDWVEECSDILNTVSRKIIAELQDENIEETDIGKLMVNSLKSFQE